MSRRQRQYAAATAAKRIALAPVESEPEREPEDWSENDEPDRTCPSCGGSGADSMESFMPCEICDGEGTQWWLP